MSITIDQAIDRVCDQKRQREDIQIPVKAFSLSLDANGEKVVGTINGRDYVPTFHCLKQMASWMGVSHAVLRQYLNPVYNQNGSVRYSRDSTDRELLVALFKNGLRGGRVDPEKEFKFRTYQDGTLRAMVSDSYGIIDNTWYLEHLKSTFKDIGGGEPHFAYFRGDADTIYGDLRIPGVEVAKPDSDYGGMLFAGNCEIGKHRISIAPGVWRQICTNGMMGWAPGQRWSRVHRGAIDLVGLASEITAKITDTLPLLTEGIDTLVATQNMAMTAKPSEIIAQIALENQLTTGTNGQAVQTIDAFLNHEKGFRNLFGIVNSITRMAHEQKDASEQFRIEEIGGKLVQLNAGQWQTLNHAGANLKPEKRNKVYGIAS